MKTPIESLYRIQEGRLIILSSITQSQWLKIGFQLTKLHQDFHAYMPAWIDFGHHQGFLDRKFFQRLGDTFMRLSEPPKALLTKAPEKGKKENPNDRYKYISNRRPIILP